MSYAERTKVPVGQSKADIEKLVKKYGAGDFGVMTLQGRAHIVFEMEERKIMFRMIVPDNDQEERSMWRAMLLTIKGKLESAERGIETFEQAFLANIVMPDGQTVAEHTIPKIEDHYRGSESIPLLPHYN